MTFQAVIERFSARRNGSGWMAKCPVHEDAKPSLSIKPGDKGGTVLFCQARCATKDVLAAKGLTMADLQPERTESGKPQIAASYDYTDEQDTLLYQVVRFSPKSFRQRRPDGSGGWLWNMAGVRRVVFGLPDVRQCLQNPEYRRQHDLPDDVFIVEGERDVNTLRTRGLIATTNVGGAGKWRDDYAEQLKAVGVESVVVLPDNDEPGREHAETVALSCHAAGLPVRIVTLPNLPVKGDVSDWLDAGHTRDDLIAQMKATAIYTPSTPAPTTAPGGPAGSAGENAGGGYRADEDRQAGAGKKESQATAIVRLVTAAGAELFHTPAGDSYIAIQVNGHREHHLLGSRGSRDYFTRIFYGETRRAPNAGALQDATATLSGIARFDGAEHEVHVRVAGANDRIYLDLGDPSHRAVEITSIGWQIVADPPVRFRRPRGLLPLPMPERGGSIADLRPFVNVATDDDFVLVVMWELAALRPQGPYPILVFMAEQGAAKTTATRILRRLVDPNDCDVRRPPRNTEDLMIAATNGHVVAFDNLSRLPDDLSDSLSMLATGSGFAVRQLFTNKEEELFRAQRPIILNGISQVATRGDLLDRAIVQTLPPITEERRKDEATFWREFEQAHPRILGALLDAVSCGLRRVPDIRLQRKPRMADFAVWGVAVEPACPWQPGTFLLVYAGNRQNAVEAILDGDPVANVVQTLAPWSGTASELLAELTTRTPPSISMRKDWFVKPRQVSDALRRLAPSLRRIGIEVTFTKHGHARTRLIEIARLESSASSASSEYQAGSADAGQSSSAGSSATSTDVFEGPDHADEADALEPRLSDDYEWERAW